MNHLLEVRNLKKYYPIWGGLFRRKIGEMKAVDDISYFVQEGEIVGLVGESGSGKSTAARTSIRLIEPTAGSIYFRGEDVMAMNRKELRHLRKSIQFIFQDPLSSLNPRKTILENVGEALLFQKLVQTQQEKQERVIDILKKVGLSSGILHFYPHQFSGGQQQRISIARALILQPALVICDEVTSALDLSIQAQILNLLLALKEELHLSYLFISHDLTVIYHLCDRILVMLQGKVVESGETDHVFRNPMHPYTKTLLQSLPANFLDETPTPFSH